MDPIVIAGIILALALNFVNGLNDASRSIATVVATKALSPGKITLASGLCNMIGPFIFTTAVAATIGTGLVESSALTPVSILVAMVASIILVFAATKGGIPLSSSHALVGALLGAGLAAGGLSALVPVSVQSVGLSLYYGIIGAAIGAAGLGLLAYWLKEDVKISLFIGAVAGFSFTIPLLMMTGALVLSGIYVIVLFIVISPVIGGAAAFLFDLLITHLFGHSRQNRMKRIFQPLQVAASLFQAASHGANDGQHAVGVITALLLSAGILSGFDIPMWVMVTSAVAIGLGTCCGGWQVVDKMARQITKIRPYQGFCAATSGSIVLAGVTSFGIPISSTHVISGAIVGVGLTRGKNEVRWNVVREMITAWIITIPLSLAVAFVLYLVMAPLLR
ncbi:MAG: inorganic phosphate transporter [Methanoregulaceae archaeon]